MRAADARGDVGLVVLLSCGGKCGSSNASRRRLEVGVGLICNSEQQVQRYLALHVKDQPPDAAIQLVNTEAQDPTACSLGGDRVHPRQGGQDGPRSRRPDEDHADHDRRHPDAVRLAARPRRSSSTRRSSRSSTRRNPPLTAQESMISRSALVLDAEELEALHECLIVHDVVAVDDDMRILVEERWPELTGKLLPPRERMH